MARTNYAKNPNQDPAHYWIEAEMDTDLSDLTIVAIYAGNEGVISMEDADGNVATVPFSAGQERMWCPKTIVGATTTATDIWILYNK